jgi:hypothetical protein
MPDRSFTGPADFNVQLAAWLAVANARQCRALRFWSANGYGE